MNPLTLRPYTQNDLPALCAIWNEVVAAGDAFPQEDCLTPETGAAFFAGQSYCGVACDEAGQLLGLYILHPNNVGRCGHICNASYAVSASDRGRGVGRQLVRDCIDQAARLGFRTRCSSPTMLKPCASQSRAQSKTRRMKNTGPQAEMPAGLLLRHGCNSGEERCGQA